MIPGPIIEELNLELKNFEVPLMQAKAKTQPKAKTAALSRRFRLLGKQAPPAGWHKFS